MEERTTKAELMAGMTTAARVLLGDKATDSQVGKLASAIYAQWSKDATQRILGPQLDRYTH